MKSCATCHNSHQAPSLELRCVVYGCACTELTADGCTEYEREPGSDDDQKWCVTSASEGRGDA